MTEADRILRAADARLHLTIVKKLDNGYCRANCSCGWTYGPDTEWATKDKAVQHGEER